MSTAPSLPAASPVSLSLGRIVALLACVEVASGFLQGFYVPIYTDIARHLHIHDADVNWFEAAQLIVSALVVPPLARMGDLVGHKRVLLLATATTAVGTWLLALAPSFTSFLVAFAIAGTYVVWLPLEIAIVHRGSAGDDARTRRSAAILVAALEVAVIVAALASGALVDAVPIGVALALPAVVVTACLVAIWVGIPDLPPASSGGLDWAGVGLVTVMLGLVMGGLVVIRVDGPGSLLAWLLIACGIAALVPLWRVEGAQPEPLVDVRLLVSRAQWPVQLTATLIGVSVLGAQIPLSTFARTDPAEAGYGLGASAAFVSDLIGCYVIFSAAGAFVLLPLARRLGERAGMAVACLFVAVGYAAWLPWHAHAWQAIVNMGVVGLGTGALVASLPAAAAAAAPSERTAFATGMTNATKTVGGAVASSVFAIALASTGSIADPARGHAPLSGYLTVWAICSATALVAAGGLMAARNRRVSV